MITVVTITMKVNPVCWIGDSEKASLAKLPEDAVLLYGTGESQCPLAFIE